MRLREMLESYRVSSLKEFVSVCGGPGPEGTRKEYLVRYLVERLTDPGSLAELWQELDPLSKKAVAAAYHGGGTFNEEAFAAQYGEVPGRREGVVIFGYRVEPQPLDLFIYGNRLPREMMEPLASLVPPPEKFRPEGLEKAPDVVELDGEKLPLWQADTEEAGLHDLATYLRLYVRGELRHSSSSGRMTPTGTGALLGNLLDGDFLTHPEGVKAADTIRPSGLDQFARGSGLAYYQRGRRKLTDGGEALLRHQDAEALLDAFETWTAESSFDELSRIKAVKGQNAKRTHLTPPDERREAIIEALSWCPTGVWIPVEELYRALLVWEFDIELDRGYDSNLCVEDPLYGRLYYLDKSSQALIETLYVGAVLMESLGSIGALDVLYLPPPEEAGHDFHEMRYSLHDGLCYFRVNRLGAYLLGQAPEYVPSRPPDAPLFTIDPNLVLALKDPGSLTPNLRDQLQQFSVEEDPQHHRLDTRQLLTTLESGGDLQHITDFLTGRHEGPLPAPVTGWLGEIGENSRAFRHAGNALFVKVRSRELVQLVLDDPTLGKLATVLEDRTLVIPANKEKAFRERLKELGYLLSQR